MLIVSATSNVVTDGSLSTIYRMTAGRAEGRGSFFIEHILVIITVFAEIKFVQVTVIEVKIAA